MATGMSGKTFKPYIMIADTPTLIANGTTYDRQRTRQKTEIPVFGDDEAIVISSTRATTLQLEFVRKSGDPGQAAFLAAAEADAEVELQLMYDDDEGYTQTFQINDDGENADPAEAQRLTFSLSPVGDREEVTSS